MKWSLRSSMIEPLISECALLLVMMWSMSVEELPWMRVALRLVSVKPLSVMELKYNLTVSSVGRLSKLILESVNIKVSRLRAERLRRWESSLSKKDSIC